MTKQFSCISSFFFKHGFIFSYILYVALILRCNTCTDACMCTQKASFIIRRTERCTRARLVNVYDRKVTSLLAQYPSVRDECVWWLVPFWLASLFFLSTYNSAFRHSRGPASHNAFLFCTSDIVNEPKVYNDSSELMMAGRRVFFRFKYLSNSCFSLFLYIHYIGDIL